MKTTAPHSSIHGEGREKIHTHFFGPVSRGRRTRRRTKLFEQCSEKGRKHLRKEKNTNKTSGKSMSC